MSLQQQSLPEPQTLSVGQTTDVQGTSSRQQMSLRERRAVEREAVRSAEEGSIEAALQKFSAIADAETRKSILTRAEAKRADEIAWSRSLDNKVVPILTVAGFAIGGLITLMTNEKLMQGKPLTQWLLFGVVLALLYAAVKSILIISPTVRVVEPVARFFGFVKPFPQRHIAHDNANEWQGHLYFGHTANYSSAARFIEDAIPHFQDEAEVLRDTLTQGYLNAQICVNKCREIAFAARGILLAVVLALIASVFFWRGW